MAGRRKRLPIDVKQQVLIEAGYRCAVPTCRNILALDLHHIEELKQGGSDDPANLIALCPTCHALFHRKIISLEAVRFWKGMLVSLTQAFDRSTIDDLLFLSLPPTSNLPISGDGVLKFTRLIGAGLAKFEVAGRQGWEMFYAVRLTPKGQAFVDAWKHGDPAALEQAEAMSI
jgi:hypothetical protein